MCPLDSYLERRVNKQVITRITIYYLHDDDVRLRGKISRHVITYNNQKYVPCLVIQYSCMDSEDLAGTKSYDKFSTWRNIAHLFKSNIEFEVSESRSELDFLLDNADVLLGYCSEEILESSKQLRYILNYSAGVDKCVKSDLLQDRDLLLTNMQRIYGPGIAEHVIGLMYMLTRKLHIFHANQQKNVWNRRAVKRTEMWEVQGRTMLIVGLGGIGTEIARRAQALGMRVIATRNSSRNGPDFVEYVGLAYELPELVKQADIVVNSTPLTPSTRNLFDRNLFKQMKSGAYFINVGRGKSVVTEDLIQALNSEHLG